MAPAPLEPSYRALQQAAKRDLGLPALSPKLLDCIAGSLAFLRDNATKAPITSKVPGKTYFGFEYGTRASRAINEGFFLDDVDEVVTTVEALLRGEVPSDPLDLHAALYSAAIAFPAVTDITKNGDRKSPGSFLEFFVGHLAATAFDAIPSRQITVPTLDLQMSLPTDFVFDLGPNRSRIHLPVKASTRERVIQVWAHQRVLDGMHGVNRFRGLLVVLAETNRQTADNTVTEVCLPDQWTAYQMYIAQLHRVYYFDVPDKYRKLRERYPFLEVKPFADFFYEYDEIAQPSLSMETQVEQAMAETD
ncbi:hypothetical protein [Curtobacterium herbarum]|nr:hypothetical protein [Curtobacterium herbarum]MBM7474907.1 hypothetical protein [Curtobacterium herbarum]MCS6545553.1 hypothetical protein [Curtobacterium herbarum]